MLTAALVCAAVVRCNHTHMLPPLWSHSDKGMQLLGASEQVATTDLQQYMQSMLDGQAKLYQGSSNGPEAVQVGDILGVPPLLEIV